MNAPLVPCPSCQRHVRITEGACPFCGAPANGDGAAEDGVAEDGVVARLPLASRGRLSSLRPPRGTPKTV